MKKLKAKISLLGILLLLNGCATIVNGPKQMVNINSQPFGAAIIIDGRDMGTTPQTLILNRIGRFDGDKSRKKMYHVEVFMDGYYPYEIFIKREVNGWFFGNAIFGGVLGIIIDAATGSMYKLTPDQVIAQMGRTSANNKQNDGIYINVALDIDPSWQKIGQLEKKM